MTEKEISIVMDALAGKPTMTTAAFANKIERVLRNYTEDSSKDILKDVVQYCLNNGTGIEYDMTTSDGNKCYTTNKEMSDSVLQSRTIRYVRSDIVEWFMSEDILPQTRYVIEEQRRGNNISLIDFDEWRAIIKIFGCKDISFEDAMKINDILWNYDISPLNIID